MPSLFDMGKTWEERLLRDLAPLIPFAPGRRAHLAFMREPYLGRVQRGEKTIESRWGLTRQAPWQAVQPGDTLVWKRSGGAIEGWSVVSFAAYHQARDAQEIVDLVRKYQRQLGVGDDFPGEVADKRFASLFWLGPHHEIDARHIEIGKTDRRAWVVLGTPA